MLPWPFNRSKRTGPSWRRTWRPYSGPGRRQKSSPSWRISIRRGRFCGGFTQAPCFCEYVPVKCEVHYEWFCSLCKMKIVLCGEFTGYFQAPLCKALKKALETPLFGGLEGKGHSWACLYTAMFHSVIHYTNTLTYHVKYIHIYWGGGGVNILNNLQKKKMLTCLPVHFELKIKLLFFSYPIIYITSAYS